MRNLPLQVPDGCALTVDELADYFGRSERLRASVVAMRRSDNELVVSFGEEVEHALVEQLVDVEQQCCPFLQIEYDPGTRMLEIGSWDAQGRAVLFDLAELFEQEDVA